MQKDINNKIKEVMSFMGKQGRGLSKRRGDKAYYQGLVKTREAKKQNNLASPIVDQDIVDQNINKDNT